MYKLCSLPNRKTWSFTLDDVLSPVAPVWVSFLEPLSVARFVEAARPSGNRVASTESNSTPQIFQDFVNVQ